MTETNCRRNHRPTQHHNKRHCLFTMDTRWCKDELEKTQNDHTELYGSQQTVNLRWRMWRVFICQWPSSVPRQFGEERSPVPDAQVTPTVYNWILKDHIGSLHGPFESQIKRLRVSFKLGTTSAHSRLPWKPKYGRPISWILLKKCRCLQQGPNPPLPPDQISLSFGSWFTAASSSCAHVSEGPITVINQLCTGFTIQLRYYGSANECRDTIGHWLMSTGERSHDQTFSKGAVHTYQVDFFNRTTYKQFLSLLDSYLHFVQIDKTLKKGHMFNPLRRWRPSRPLAGQSPSPWIWCSMGNNNNQIRSCFQLTDVITA